MQRESVLARGTAVSQFQCGGEGVAIVDVAPGVCGLKTRIVANADDSYNVTIEISSKCKKIQRIAEQIKEISVLEELVRPITETTPYVLAASCETHAACPVPMAIIKAIEVAAGMALPADVHITISKD